MAHLDNTKYLLVCSWWMINHSSKYNIDNLTFHLVPVKLKHILIHVAL